MFRKLFETLDRTGVHNFTLCDNNGIKIQLSRNFFSKEDLNLIKMEMFFHFLDIIQSICLESNDTVMIGNITKVLHIEQEMDYRGEFVGTIGYSFSIDSGRSNL